MERQMPTIKGRNLNLRPISWDTIVPDAQNVVAWAKDSEVNEALRYFSFFQKEITLGRQLRYFSRMIGASADKVFIIETESGGFLGTCGLHDIDQVNENLRIGIIIFNKNFRRQGYGKRVLDLLLSFAFNELGMNKVYLTARADNERAICIYEKLGFAREGVLRKEYKVKDGQYIDLLRMSILKSEWLGRRIYEALAD